MNIPEPLLPLFDDGIIHEVIRPLMSGKEASVYIVRSQEGICVAKVRLDAEDRSFRQRADYAEGRIVRNSRQQRAMGAASTEKRCWKPNGRTLKSMPVSVGQRGFAPQRPSTTATMCC